VVTSDIILLMSLTAFQTACGFHGEIFETF